MPVALATATRDRSRVGLGNPVGAGGAMPQPQVEPVPQLGPQSQPHSSADSCKEVVGRNRSVSLAICSMCTRVAAGGALVWAASGTKGTNSMALAPNSAKVSAMVTIWWALMPG